MVRSKVMALSNQYSGFETSASPSSNSTSTLRKTASVNSSKNFSEIQRWDQKLWTFRTGTQVSKPPPHRVAIPHLLQGKQRLETLLKICARSNRRIKSYGHSELVLRSVATTPPPHRVAIPHLLQGKQRSKTFLKI
jgi:hypothetical protein